MIPTTQIPSRVCSRCKSDKTHFSYYKVKNGELKTYPLWKYDYVNGGYICQNCYSHDIGNKRTAPRRLRYKGKRITIDRDPRIGVCCWCRAVRNEVNAQTDKVCKETQMHHEGEYVESDKLKNTLEICASCHGKTPKREN